MRNKIFHINEVLAWFSLNLKQDLIKENDSTSWECIVTQAVYLHIHTYIPKYSGVKGHMVIISCILREI